MDILRSQPKLQPRDEAIKNVYQATTIKNVKQMARNFIKEAINAQKPPLKAKLKLRKVNLDERDQIFKDYFAKQGQR